MEGTIDLKGVVVRTNGAAGVAIAIDIDSTVHKGSFIISIACHTTETG